MGYGGISNAVHPMGHPTLGSMKLIMPSMKPPLRNNEQGTVDRTEMPTLGEGYVQSMPRSLRKMTPKWCVTGWFTNHCVGYFRNNFEQPLNQKINTSKYNQNCIQNLWLNPLEVAALQLYIGFCWCLLIGNKRICGGNVQSSTGQAITTKTKNMRRNGQNYN